MKKLYAWVLLATFTVAVAYATTPRTQLLSRLPLRFEPNAAPGATSRYIARGPNFILNLAPAENWLDWSDSQGRSSRVRMRLVNANRHAKMGAEDRLPGLANYFIGSAPQWRTNVTAFGRICYRDIYPGIDLVFHGENGRLEYDFLVAPHAALSDIRWSLNGQRTLRIAKDGDLVITTDAGEIRWKRPEAYQEIAGVRHPVDGRFILDGGNVRFRVDAYDRAQPLVIDPALKYSTYLGGAGNDALRGVAVDAAGNIYISGNSTSMDLPTVSAYQPNFAGMTTNPETGDGIIAKFSPSGTLLYLTYLGGSQDDGVIALAVDAAGDAYLTGETNSPDFPVVSPYQAHYGGAGGSSSRTGDVFVAKLSPTGNNLMYSTYLGGSGDDIGMAIAVDSAGDAYVAGGSASKNFPVTTGAFQTTMAGAGGETIRPETNLPFLEPGDAFIAKLDPSGSKLLYSTFLGGSLDDLAMSIALDASNNVYVGGCTISQNFPTTPGALQTAYAGAEAQNVWLHLGDGFIAKLSSTGSLVYSTYLGGSGDDCITGIAVDASGSVYAAGSTTSVDLKTSSGAFQRSMRGYGNAISLYLGDAFAAKLSPDGSSLSYLTYLGGSNNDAAVGIGIDTLGDAYVTGFTDSPNFPVSSDALQPKFAGDGQMRPNFQYGDAFLTVVNPTGTGLVYSSFFGGSLDDRPFGIALDGQGSVYLTGNTVSTNFPVTSNALIKTFQGDVANDWRGGKMFGDAYYAVMSGFPVGPPVVTKVANAEGENPVIAPNTWVEIKGMSFSPTSRIWLASDFVNNLMPTVVDNVSVTMNNEPCYIYYISNTQINVLTPPDLASGTAQVVVTVSGRTSPAFSVQVQPTSPSLFIFGAGPYVAAVHAQADGGGLIGPSTLYPGLTTPVKPGQTFQLYANGFGPTDPAVVKGSETQSGILTSKAYVKINGVLCDMSFGGVVSPGLYQFNVTVPPTTSPGDQVIQAQLGALYTQAGTLITVASQ
jgi:uncharacterized protein (TIGR03437 family)